MGVYYYYLNHTKQQMFCTDPIGPYFKRSFVGINLGSVALHHLLSNELSGESPWSGAWIGDEIEVVADIGQAYDLACEAGYEEVEGAVLEMLCLNEGADQILDHFRYVNNDVDLWERVRNGTDIPAKVQSALENAHMKLQKDQTT